MKNVLTCVKEMRIQAENISRVHSIYVVDDEDRLKGVCHSKICWQLLPEHLLMMFTSENWTRLK
jgi:Mg/Co/Ni transporter MgtE